MGWCVPDVAQALSPPAKPPPSPTMTPLFKAARLEIRMSLSRSQTSMRGFDDDVMSTNDLVKEGSTKD
ncbi:hypothetical protein GCM10009069_17660 [Algimonas arctica]|uniref:Uncharacterized protein n=1 Tax=Algimonas arctica TaxID=1479486 RepID=A0A8J3G2I2_9PROT|nr:hypothetical protein GCM10009069_17660 [Algimonas arctica]